MLDLLITGGQVADGTGTPCIRADIGVQDGRIVAVGQLRGEAAHRRIDAKGLVTAPGFIDVHAHDDELLLQRSGAAHPKVLQGVTTVVTGNCGISLAPLLSDDPPAPLDALGADVFRFSSFGQYLDAVDDAQPLTNAACLVGHTTLRAAHVADLQRSATAAERERMRKDLQEAMQAGAWGLSTGLYYPPARAATAEEVIDVAQPMAGSQAPIAMHIRDEGDRIDDALREAFAISRALDVPLVLSHHKLVGKQNHGRSRETLAMIEQAAAGSSVCMDCYPYDASSTMLLPSRVAQSREVMVSWSATQPEAAGKSLFALARERGETPEQTAAALLPAGAIYFAMSEEDVARILQHPLAMVGSDGLAHDSHPHPRLWGTFPRVLGRYARDQKLFPLETAVHKMTGLPAARFGLERRGRIAVGMHADLVTFDPATVADRATFEAPHQAPAGIAAVYVAGRCVSEHGQMTGERPGRVLRRTRP